MLEDLNEVEKKLDEMVAQKEINDQRCLEAIHIIKDFKKKVNETMSKISML